MNVAGEGFTRKRGMESSQFVSSFEIYFIPEHPFASFLHSCKIETSKWEGLEVRMVKSWFVLRKRILLSRFRARFLLGELKLLAVDVNDDPWDT